MPVHRGVTGETMRRFEALEEKLVNLGDELNSLFELVLVEHHARIEALEVAARAPSRRRSRRRSGRRKKSKR